MEASDLIAALVISGILLLTFFAAVILFIVQYRRRRIRHEKEKSNMHELHKQDLLNAQIEVQRETMQYIGREIHDNIGQQLTLASLSVSNLTYHEHAAALHNELTSINAMLRDALTELRRLSKSLIESHHEPTLQEMLETECTKVASLNFCKIILTNNTELTTFNLKANIFILRIVQEFIQNSLKYAKCENINIDVSGDKDFFLLKLQDDGKGFDMTHTASASGIGLKNIKNRADILGAELNMTSALSKGTQLSLRIREPHLSNLKK